ncbi:MAG: DIP1984 family protein [Pasteurellaceae bacterium]|nr:DIP1984 family protein [Pasteurellaceae bacterium]
MKLAEALMQRADYQRHLAQLQQRLQQNAKYQESEKPAEDPQELLREYRQVANGLRDLIVKINQRNNQVKLNNGINMVEALAERDRLKAEHSTLIHLAESALPDQDRYSRSEIKIISAVDIKLIRKQADEIAKKHRELDVLIQQANWKEEL